MSFNGQTAYNLAPAVGKVGAIAESAEGIHAIARVASVAIPFGCFSVRDASDLKSKLPTTAAEVLAGLQGVGGVAVATHAIVSDPSTAIPLFPIGKEFAALRKGPIFVLVEEDVTQGDQAYIRYADAVATQNATYLAANGAVANQKGAFRKSYDGTAQVSTLTPTAANGDVYSVEIRNDTGRVIGAASYIGDGSATAAEIVTGLKAALGTVTGIALSGTSTLIITASTAGAAFTVAVSANIAVVATQANVASAAPAPGMYYKTTASAGGLAIVECNLGGT